MHPDLIYRYSEVEHENKVMVMFYLQDVETTFNLRGTMISLRGTMITTSEMLNPLHDPVFLALHVFIIYVSAELH